MDHCLDILLQQARSRWQVGKRLPGYLAFCFRGMLAAASSPTGGNF